jgi:protein SCO1
LRLESWFLSGVRSSILKKTLACTLLALALVACGGPSFSGSALDEPVDVPDFDLIDQRGEGFHLSALRGNVVLLFFGYTQCPDVCPTTLITWRHVYETLGDDANGVRFVFVTVDPERDTAEQLRLHVSAFHPDFIGLTGPPDQMEALYEVFDIFSEKVDSSGGATGYLISHTATTFVLDPEGRWRLRESYGTPVEDLVHDIRLLLE